MKNCLLLLCYFGISSCSSIAPSAPVSDIWLINSLEKIGDAPLTIQGNPQLIDTALGKVISFDGDGDRLLVDKNPLAGATEFTIEIIFNPADAFPNNTEPRFFHIEAMDNPNRRLTVELRLNDAQQWYLDAYIKSEKSQLTLIDSTQVHPVGKWAHAAVTYKNRELISYVNGKKELTGQVDYLPIAATAKTSIGARMNQIHWFNGEIAQIRISHRALNPLEFLSVAN